MKLNFSAFLREFHDTMAQAETYVTVFECRMFRTNEQISIKFRIESLIRIGPL